MIQPQPRIYPICLACHSTFRCFLVRFNNARRHGKYPIRTYEAYGCVFPEGQVAVNSNDLQRKGFENMTDLMETLGQYGEVEVIEMGEVSV